MYIHAKDKKTHADYGFKIQERELKELKKWMKKEDIFIVKNKPKKWISSIAIKT